LRQNRSDCSKGLSASGELFIQSINRVRKYILKCIDFLFTGTSLVDLRVGIELVSALKQISQNRTKSDTAIPKTINVWHRKGVDMYLLVDISKVETPEKMNETLSFVYALLPEVFISLFQLKKASFKVKFIKTLKEHQQPVSYRLWICTKSASLTGCS
jgi:hypothetical protein